MNARKLAYTALLRVEKEKGYSNLTLDALFRGENADPRDRQLAASLFYGVLERKLTLDHVIGGYTRKKLSALDDEVAAALELGLYQLLYMDGIPDSAAVNESVELIKKSRKKSAAGFVNGVLRSFLRDGKRVPLPKGEGLERASVEFSMPLSILKRWEKDYSRETAVELAKACLGRPPLHARVNTLRCAPEEAAAALAAEGVEVRLHPVLPGCLELSGTGSVAELEPFRKGWIAIQDTASQLCAWALGAQPGETVFDLCAAPGSKSFTVAELMGDRGTVLAFDLHPSRVALIEKGAARLGISCIRAEAGDASRFRPELGLADRVLCDVPCSGLGIIRRKPEIRYKSDAELDGLPPIQLAILENGSRYVKPGGTLLYSTCALSRQENDQVADRFLEGHPEFEPEGFPETVRAVLGEDCARKTLMPMDGGFDGFFLARFRRKI